MYTPKRLKSNRPESPFASPFPSLNISKEQRDTPSRGNRDTPSRGVSVLEQDECYQLVTYGGNLPVNVAELLAGADSANLSAKIENSGWAYIINNRKLYAWKTSSSLIKKTVSGFEFQLPATDIPHKASLTCILESSLTESSVAIANKTSLISVSPEGVARYWPNITQPTVVVETALNIGEKQCFAIQSIMPYGCILVTTTNEMYQLTPSNSAINHHQVAVSSGMLSSIGKRMSSFWSQPAISQSNHPPSICNGTLDFDGHERYIFMAVDKKLQKWEFSGYSFGSSKLLYEVDLLSCVNFYPGITEFSIEASIDDLQVIDMKNTGYGTVLLLVLVIGDEKKIVLGTLKSNVEDSQFNFERLVSIDYHDDVLSGDLQLLIPFGGYQAYISTKNVIISQPVSKSTRNPIKVEFKKGNSGILGAGCCGSDAIYLSLRDGLVNLKVTYVAEPILMEKGKVQFFNETSSEDASENRVPDIYSNIRTAFISHSQGKVQTILNVISPIECDPEVGEVIMKLSSEILDGYPPSDPRWTMSNPAFPPSSVLLLNQLRDKEKIHEEYLNFVSIYDLLEKVGESSEEVKINLCESAEMLKCAIALLEMPSYLSNIVDDVISSPELDVQSDEAPINRKDSFFGKISNIRTFFSTLLNVEGNKLSGLQAIQEQVDIILYVSEIITSCFQSAWQYRQNTPHKYNLTNHVPWTASKTGNNNRELLKHQIDLVLNQALCNVDSTKAGSGLTRQIVLLSDLLFDGFLREIAALKVAENLKEMEAVEDEYNRERNKVIMALVNFGYFEEATTLSEHYKDFQMLIFLCERINDTQKLKYYKVLFKNEGFADVLYKWYVEKGAWSQLMTSQDESDNFDALLSSHKQLSWLHFIGSNEYTKASDVLTHLATEEKEHCERKKSMLVLANLATLAADEPANVIEENMSVIDKQLDLINYQEQVLKSLEKDAIDSPPLTAEELIKLCLGDDVPVLTESQYITLIELLQFVSVNRQHILLDIWAKCVLQDSWEEAANIDSVAVISQKIFYKCLKYWTNKGDPSENIPALKSLMTRFTDIQSCMIHQLKVCYEALTLQELSAGI